ncbi:MAG: erythromycin esterase family protein [Gammaproteobacteria bacterium]|nr:erythromycin esterase family protein [Gammaproteobacteria bacterium]
MKPNLFLITTGFVFSISVQAQPDSKILEEFEEWIETSAYEITETSLDASSSDLAPIERMIGDARIIGLSEGLHSPAEPLVFRNRLFKYLVEDLGFKAIVIESGIVESKALNDYAIGFEDSLENSLSNGISYGFDQLQGNHSLLRWIRSHNDSLPDGEQKVQIFGMDVSGSPPGLVATRKPDAPLRYTLEYLDSVDAKSAELFRERVGPLLPILASGNGYGMLSQSERDGLTASIEDMISLVARRKLEYIAVSTEYDYLWGERAAIAARQTDSWFRRMPLEWTPSGDYTWTAESQNIRDRTMAENFDWVLDQLNSTDRVLVFASVNHIAAEQHELPHYLVDQGQRQYKRTPFGYYAKTKYGGDFTNILNVVGSGEIKPCFQPGSIPIAMEVPRPDWIDARFHDHSMDEYFIDLRDAPEGVSNWLSEVREQRNARISALGSFDIVYYIAEFTHDCL